MAKRRVFSWVVKASDGKELPFPVAKQRQIIKEYAQSEDYAVVKEYEGRFGVEGPVLIEILSNARNEVFCF